MDMESPYREPEREITPPMEAEPTYSEEKERKKGILGKFETEDLLLIAIALLLLTDGDGDNDMISVLILALLLF